MKIAVIIVRMLLGFLFLFASVVVLLNLFPKPEVFGDVKIFNEGLAASGYMMTLIKVTELGCAIAFISGRFVPLATVVIFPVSLNIFLFHSFLAPDGMPVAIFVLLANLFLAFAYRKKYSSMLKAKNMLESAL